MYHLLSSLRLLFVYIDEDYNNSYSIGAEKVKIGRDPSLSDIIISELIVSKFHCTVSFNGKTFLIKDNNSTNGLFDEKGNRIFQCKVKNDEWVKIGKKGKVKMLFHIKK